MNPKVVADAMKRTCIDCGGLYVPSGVRQQRCGICGFEHNRKKNAQYQTAFRARHRTKEEAERIQRRTWQLDGAKYRAEALHADGMSPSAIAQKLGCSHHTLLRHLARPEAQRRVAILRNTDMPELPC
jgi:DNA-binding CsgD family transcriptional regulator